MKKNIIISILVVLFVLGGLLWLGKLVQKPISVVPGGSVKTSGENTLLATETSYDFGTISMKNGLVSKIFIITNPTEQEINLESVTTSCMCTVAYVVNGENKKGPFGMPGHGSVPKVNERIPTGESREIEVVYDPNAHGPAGIGKTERVVRLEYADGKILDLNIKAFVTP